MALGDDILAVLRLSGGRLVGRIRLQKTLFLMDMAGADIDAHFEYHHYGPYSSDVSSGLYWAETEGSIQEEFGYRNSDGARYSVFVLQDNADVPEAVGCLSDERSRELIGQFEQENSTVLELAATALWLRRVENIENWQGELIRRKARKASQDRIERAVALLERCAIPV